MKSGVSPNARDRLASISDGTNILRAFGDYNRLGRAETIVENNYDVGGNLTFAVTTERVYDFSIVAGGNVNYGRLGLFV